MARPKTEAATYERFSAALPPDVLALLRAKAKRAHTNVNTELILALRRALRASKTPAVSAS